MNFTSETPYLNYDRTRKAKAKRKQLRLKIMTKMANVANASLFLGAAIYFFYYPHIREVFAYSVENIDVIDEDPLILTPAAEPAKEVLIEVKIDWTQERIIKEINTTFWDAPIMVRVAQCEGVVNGKLDPNAFNPTNGSDDEGGFQISKKWNGKWYRSLGFTDMTDVRQNIAFARIMYDTNGLQPWEASKPCWNK